ncbi:MAG: MarR family winged helix-turn-helix transcriptional regulator [Archangium sp.]
MGVVLAMELLLEQIRAKLSVVLAGYELTPAAWQMLAWLTLERTASGSRLGDLTYRHRSEAQHLLTKLEKRGLVERVPDFVTNKTAAWELTDDGRALAADVTRRLEVFDRLMEREFYGHIETVMDAVTRIRSVLATSSLTSTGEMYEARLRTAGKLVPPKEWKANRWDW